MKILKLLVLLSGFSLPGEFVFGGIDLTFRYVFATNNSPEQKVKRMNANTFFDRPIQIQFAEAVARKNTNQMQQLLEKGADANYQGDHGMKPLFWALINQSIEGVRFLLRNGADPNAEVNAKQPPVENALTLAARLKDSKFTKELLAHGANPNASVGSLRETAIFTAAFYRRHENLTILLAAGADINWQTVNGDTALHAAIRQSAFETALLLYRAGANPTLKTSYGYSSIDSLKQFGGRLILKRSDVAPYKLFCQELVKAGLLNASDVR